MISGIWTRFLLNNRFAAIVDKKDLAYESQVLFAVENVAQFQVYPEAGLSFFQSFSVFSWAAAFDFAEYFGIVVRVGKSGFFGYGADGFFGIQVFQTAFDSVFLQECKKSSVHVPFEQTGTFTFT